MTKGQFQAGCFIYATGSGIIVMLGPQRDGTTLDFWWFMSICGAFSLGCFLSLFKAAPTAVVSIAPRAQAAPRAGGAYYGGAMYDDQDDYGGGWDYDPPDYGYDPPEDFAELSFREMNGDD